MNFLKFINKFFEEHYQKTASDYSSINSSEGRIGKRNCKLWCKKKHMYQFELEPKVLGLNLGKDLKY